MMMEGKCDFSWRTRLVRLQLVHYVRECEQSKAVKPCKGVQISMAGSARLLPRPTRVESAIWILENFLWPIIITLDMDLSTPYSV